MTETNSLSPVVQALRSIQQANGWTDQEMADELGVARVTWRFFRRGRNQPNVESLRRIAARFPQLREAVNRHLQAA